MYDYVITLDSEVTLFWTARRVTGPLVLFLLSRYLTFAVQILGWIPSPSSFQYFPWAAFSTLKSYAMCADSYPVYISAVVFALSSVPLFISLLESPHKLKLLWTSFSNVPGRGFVPVPELSATMVMK
ncbi:hypothetical protein BD310DRAFT_907180 [Dichomitus squalens]|uniref:DUF6533 domain-containing protein n=1 Tax=Dichomitus squalens TaxID=114155 RepID=A0A4Q9PSQ9_9APHY|nr:hypothetical protein BD310DRAFT_907180 [Dichomitus squalens]